MKKPLTWQGVCILLRGARELSPALREEMAQCLEKRMGGRKKRKPLTAWSALSLRQQIREGLALARKWAKEDGKPFDRKKALDEMAVSWRMSGAALENLVSKTIKGAK